MKHIIGKNILDPIVKKKDRLGYESSKGRNSKNDKAKPSRSRSKTTIPITLITAKKMKSSLKLCIMIPPIMFSNINISE